VAFDLGQKHQLLDPVGRIKGAGKFREVSRPRDLLFLVKQQGIEISLVHL
jgi:hypothetical protein